MEEVTVRLNRESRKGGYSPEDIHLVFPSSWDELTPYQLLYIGKYWQAWQDLARLGESSTKARSLLMLQLCGLSSRSEKRKLCKFLSFVDEKTDVNILSLVDFVFENITLTKNLLPKISVGYFTWFHGPQDRLKDITIEEFSFAFAWYQLYARTQVETHLDSLVLVLYRPANPDYRKTGEIREPFISAKVEMSRKRISKLQLSYKMAVFLFFSGCLEALVKRFPEIFKRAEKDRKGGGSFLDSVRQMSGGKFGHYDITKQQNMIVFLTDLQEQMRRMEEEKRNSKK